MKLYGKFWFTLLICYLCWAVLLFFAGKRLLAGDDDNRMAFMNRMTYQISETGSTDVSAFLEDFETVELPSEITIVTPEDMEAGAFSYGGDNIYIRPLKDDSGEVKAFVRYVYPSRVFGRFLLLMIISGILLLLPIIFFIAYIHRNIIKPFHVLSDYPEKLAKGLMSEGLPESKSRMFGRYVWGMNMLGTKLLRDRQEINRLLHDRKEFISTLAHGIKTPVSNIKLYSEAIETGLYRNGDPDPRDSEIAAKISRNADDIAALVSRILSDPGALQDNCILHIETFYLSEVKDWITEEFANRLRIKDIPFAVEITGDPLVASDRQAIMRCLTQMLENAVKYGDGTGIRVRLYRQDDITFFSVSNNGTEISEKEIPFVFNCYYRGTNAAGKEGSGIGLYEARSVARALGGDMMMKVRDAATEVILYLPDEQEAGEVRRIDT